MEPERVVRRGQRLLASRRGTLVVVTVCLIATPLLASPSVLAQTPPLGATTEVRDVVGRLVATGEFREGRGEVLITLNFPAPAGLSGTHAIHLQEVGRCDPPDFLTAGPDFNPLNKKHGRQNPDGPHVGDLPNVNFTNGLTTYNTSAPGATLGTGPGSLLGPNRTALVIYAGEDDQMTDPDGNSGARIACGVIAPPPAPGAVAPPKPVAVPSALATPEASPVAVQPAPSPVPARPVVPNAVASPPAANPIPIVVAPTPLPLAAATSTQTSGSSLGTGPALIIAILGVGLVGAGYLLWRRGQPR